MRDWGDIVARCSFLRQMESLCGLEKEKKIKRETKMSWRTYTYDLSIPGELKIQYAMTYFTCLVQLAGCIEFNQSCSTRG